MKLLEKHFESALETPDGITRLRELILKLAMQGKLVEQNSNDKPAKVLIKEINDAKQKIVGQKKNKNISPLISEDEIIYRLPNKWIWCRLNQISEYIQRGKGPVYSEIEEIPVISQKCIQWSGFNKDVVKFISPESIDKYQPERFIRKGDLLWNSTGTGTLGRINIYNDELKHFSIVVADSHVTVVRPIIVNSFYILNFLKSPYVQDTIEANASGTTNQIELNTSTVINQVIPLPPLEEQKRIVEKIDQLMLLCDKLEAERNRKKKLQLQMNSAAINNLIRANDEITFNNAWSFIANQFDTLYTVKQNVTDLKEVILNLAMRGKLVSQDNQEQSAIELHKEILIEKTNLIKSGSIRKQKELPAVKKDEITYELPKNWKWVRLNDFGTWKSGSTPNRSNSSFYEGNIPWVKSGEVKQGRIKYTSETITEFALEKCSLHINPIGSVLIAMYGANIGEAGVLEIEATTNQAVCACNAYKGIDNNYLYNLILSLKNNFISQGAGAAQPNISREKIINTVVPLPPYDEQKRIVKRVNQLFELCDTLEKDIEQSSKKQSQLLNAVLAQV